MITHSLVVVPSMHLVDDFLVGERLMVVMMIVIYRPKIESKKWIKMWMTNVSKSKKGKK